jgi:hypothetical protein
MPRQEVCQQKNKREARSAVATKRCTFSGFFCELFSGATWIDVNGLLFDQTQIAQQLPPISGRSCAVFVEIRRPTKAA